MSGFIAVFGPCWCCKDCFLFDPDQVASVLIDPEIGLPPDLGGDSTRAIRMPLCDDCVAESNRRRAAAGRPLIGDEI